MMPSPHYIQRFIVKHFLLDENAFMLFEGLELILERVVDPRKVRRLMKKVDRQHTGTVKTIELITEYGLRFKVII